MKTVKAGCILVDADARKVALVYRERYNDFSFPKGHLEVDEKVEECAVRETAEETKRVAKIVAEYRPIEENYVTPAGEDCVCYMFIALDEGKSDNNSLDTHDTYWIPFEEVEDKLSYPSLKTTWRKAKDRVEKLFK